MNQFIFCVVANGQISYGTMLAKDGADARRVLDERYLGRIVQKVEIKGVASRTFEFDVVGGIYVPRQEG